MMYGRDMGEYGTKLVWLINRTNMARADSDVLFGPATAAQKYESCYSIKLFKKQKALYNAFQKGVITRKRR